MPLTRRRFVQCAALSACALALPSIARAAPLVLRLSSTMTADENSAHYLFYQRLAENLKQSVGDRIRIDFSPTANSAKRPMWCNRCAWARST